MITNHLSENCQENGHKLFTMTANLDDHQVDMWYENLYSSN